MVENPSITFDPKIGLSHLWIQPTVVSNLGLECQNTVFYLQLVESADVKPLDSKGRLYVLKKNQHIRRSAEFKCVLFKGQLYYIFLI